MFRNKLYTSIIIACFVGFIYLFFSIYSQQKEIFQLCIIKNITGYSCPSCGTTRAVILLFQGKIINSIFLNPFGILMALIMSVIPFWILTDVVLNKETFYIWFQKTEVVIKNKWLASFLVALVILNWIWNLYKNL